MKDRESMTCSDYQEMLASMHEDDHSFEEWVGLNDHLETCTACAAVRAEYRAMRAFIRQIPAPEPPSGIPPKLLQIWDEQNKERPSIAAGQLEKVSEPTPSTSLVPYTTQKKRLQSEKEIATGHRALSPKSTSFLIKVLSAIPLSIGVIASIAVILSSLNLIPYLNYLLHGGISLNQNMLSIGLGLFWIITALLAVIWLTAKVMDMVHYYKIRQQFREMDLEKAKQSYAHSWFRLQSIIHTRSRFRE